jgi:hypothetical protein
MSSGSPSQIVHEVGGPTRRRPSQLVHGQPGELALQVVQRVVERGARRVLAGCERPFELRERERIVAQCDAVEPGERRLRRLVVVRERGCLTEA